jgi:hypothetical protein
MRVRTFLSLPRLFLTSLRLAHPVSLLVHISVLFNKVPSVEVIACVGRSLGPSDSQSCCIHREAQTRRGEEPDVDPEQFQDPGPDNDFGLSADTTYEADDVEAGRSKPKRGMSVGVECRI